MTPQQENALRSIARLANSEIKKARQQFPDKNVDDICRSVLKKHRETVTLMGFTPTHLSLAIGMLIEQDPLVTIDIITHRYYGVGGQWVQDAGEYLHMMSDAGIRIKGE